MGLKEFSEKVGKILGIKSAEVISALIGFNETNRLNQHVYLSVKPTEQQAKKLKELAKELVN